MTGGQLLDIGGGVKDFHRGVIVTRDTAPAVFRMRPLKMLQSNKSSLS